MNEFIDDDWSFRGIIDDFKKEVEKREDNILTLTLNKALENNPRECFTLKNKYRSGDTLFYSSCVRDSKEWKEIRANGGHAVITWDIICPFCKEVCFSSVPNWSNYRRIGINGCENCELKFLQKIHTEMLKNYENIDGYEI